MSNRKSIVILGLLLVAIAFSCLIYFGVNTNEKDEISICSFVFTLVAECIIFGGMFFSSKEHDVHSLIPGLVAITTGYSIISIIMNVFFSGLFSSLRWLIIANSILILVFVFILLMEVLATKEKK